MFALTMGAGQNIGFPDVCLTPAGPAVVPVPYPNLSQSALTPTSVKPVLCSCTPTVNLMSPISISNGNQAGSLTGVVSHKIMGSTSWVLGSVKCFIGGSPVQRMTSVSSINCMEKLPNGVGSCLVPSQPRVLVLG